VGDTSFTATDDASDVQPGEWLLINDYDSVFGDRAAVDWVQVESVAGNVVARQRSVPYGVHDGAHVDTGQEWLRVHTALRI